jgi:hypothetical protein
MPNKYNTGILKNLRVGISKIETGGHKDPYGATAGDANKDGKPDSTALGKYQFLKKYWWDKKGTGGKIMGFKEFAAAADGAYGEINKWEDIAGNKALQEAYFGYYAENHLIPEAKKAMGRGNPMNLTLDQATALIHFKGHGAGGKAISTGKFEDKTDTNVSDSRYLRVFNEALEAEGLSNYTLEDYAKEKTEVEPEAKLDVTEKKAIKSREERMASYEKKEANIQKMDVDETVKNDLYKKLFQEITDNGDRDVWNEKVEEINTENKGKRESHMSLLNAFKDSDAQYIDRKGEDNDEWKFLNSGLITEEEADKLKKEFPEVLKGFSKKKDHETGKYKLIKHRHTEGSFEDFAKNFNKVNKEYFGDAYQETSLKKAFEGEDAGFLDKLWSDIKTTARYINQEGPARDTKFSSGELDSSKVGAFKEKVKIDSEYFKPTKKEWETPDSEDITLDGEIESEWVEDENEEEDSEPQGESAIGKSLDLEKQVLDASMKDQKGYDKSDYKKELPVDAVTGLALGLIGNEQAKNAKVPLRTEDVSQAIKSYTSELARRSKEGLPPEMEAAITNKLAEAYQGGLNTLSNKSNGNSAALMGNLGQLENAKSRGLVDAQVADYQAKMQAGEQYGQAIQYIDKARRDREIANTSLRQQQGLMQQRDGQELAAAGFKKMMDGIKYQRENGPGSANHMYQSALMQRIFGYDPNKKDDGSGTVPGTKSYAEKQQAQRMAAKQNNLSLTEQFYSLPPEVRAKIDQEYLNNPTQANREALISQHTQQYLQGQAEEQPIEQPVQEGSAIASSVAGTTPVASTENPESKGMFTPLGFIPNSILNKGGGLGTEPQTVSPTVNIAEQAQSVGIAAHYQGDQIALAGGSSQNMAQMPTYTPPKNPIFENANPVELPKPNLESGLAASVKNQMNYYNNQ